MTTVDRIVKYTKQPYCLVVCDDGSTDDTVQSLKEQGHKVIVGKNRGVAWNKNRALFYLFAIRHCDPIILLEDDTSPVAEGWEQPWCEAASLYGHANLAGWWFQNEIDVGSGTPHDPYISKSLTAQCSVFSSQALAYVGYMDSRFGTYGYEHIEHSNRMIRAGYGGTVGESYDEAKNFLLKGESLHVDCLNETVNSGNILHNAGIFLGIRHEEIFRNAWRGDEEMNILRAEINSI